MRNPIEAAGNWYSSTEKRVNPEGLAASTAIATASIGTIVPMEAGITYSIHEIAQRTDPNLLNFGIAAGLVAANAVSIALDAKALRRREFSASPIGTLFYAGSGKPLVSSVGEHIWNNVQLNLLNPINGIAVYNNDPQLLSESAVATSLVITLWSGPINHLIAEGKADPLINTMKKFRRQATTGWKLANYLMFGG